MRFFFISLIVSLFSLAAWPWVKQFLLYIKSQYKEATNFGQESVEDASPDKLETPENVTIIRPKKEPENDKDN